jgi:anaerobic selenocysteine-containing dehydrogenase
MLSAHRESGHYFNPQAQRIIDAQTSGQAKLCVIDTRLSNSAAKADYWLSTWPGTESALLLAIAGYLIREDRCNWEFVLRWTNWRELLADRAYLSQLREFGRIADVPDGDDFETFKALLAELYAPYTFAAAAEECGVDAGMLESVAREVADAGSQLATHVWRSAAAGNRGGWMVARCLFLLNVLTGSVGSEGGTLPNQWTKFVPKPHSMPAPVQNWNENHWPAAWPLAHFEMSFLLPHLLRAEDREISVYFSRVYNPVWTNPDVFAWIEMLSDEQRIGVHAALTPVWSESAQYADYVLPMGLGPERHDLHSYETHAAQWLGFRQPVQRVAREEQGESLETTLGSNTGEVWEENEFWIELSWRIDPDGALGIRQHFESPERPGAKITIEEYYRWIFEHSVPGLPEAAAAVDATPMQYMRERGAFELTRDVHSLQERPIDAALADAAVEHDGALWSEETPPKVNFAPIPGPFRDAEGRVRIGIGKASGAVQGFPTPSGKLEFFSPTLKEWGWPEFALPYHPLTQEQRESAPAIVSQVHPSQIDNTANEYVLLPTFRLPTLIHSRTNGAKWLHELAHINPVWIHPQDAARMSVETGELVRVQTAIGGFVDRCWVTEAIRPGVVACSHHLGRWRLQEDHGSDRWNSAVVAIDQRDDTWRMTRVHGSGPFEGDRDSARIWWSDGGVHQNLTFPVQPDPISGQHCWHQKVRVSRATEAEYGEIQVDQAAAQRVYEEWLSLTRPATDQPERRPYWLLRPLKPHPDAYRRDAT